MGSWQRESLEWSTQILKKSWGHDLGNIFVRYFLMEFELINLQDFFYTRGTFLDVSCPELGLKNPAWLARLLEFHFAPWRDHYRLTRYGINRSGLGRKEKPRGSRKSWDSKPMKKTLVKHGKNADFICELVPGRFGWKSTKRRVVTRGLLINWRLVRLSTFMGG